MLKKGLAILLIVIMSIWSAGVLAKSDGKSSSKGSKKSVTISEDSKTEKDTDVKTTEEEKDAAQDVDKDEEAEQEKDTEVKEDADNTETDEDKDEDIDKESEVTEDQNQVSKGKSKIAKDQLKAKKQERAEARVEAKEYIKGIKELFKDADPETKKEILAQIAEVKRELKQYSIGAFVRGLAVDFDKFDGVEPIIEEGRTLVPVRAVTETLGAIVEWAEETSTITITKDDTKIVLQLDNKTAYVNDQAVELEVAPTTKKDRTLVPIRFIAEQLGLKVDWDDDSQTVIVE